jgi:hypothetical protein
VDLEGNASSNGGGGRSNGSSATDTRTCQNVDSYVELEMKCFDGGKSRRLVIIKETELGNLL